MTNKRNLWVKLSGTNKLSKVITSYLEIAKVGDFVNYKNEKNNITKRLNTKTDLKNIKTLINLNLNIHYKFLETGEKVFFITEW